MSTYQVTATGSINAPAEQVYAIIADYRNGHPHILPPQFSNLEVEQGGIGAGTVIRFQVTTLGRTQNFRAAVIEPEPGRVLVETDLDTGAVTTFTVTPLERGRSQATILTEFKNKGGLLGSLERWMTSLFLPGIYKQELVKLAALAEGRVSRPSKE